MYKKEGIQDEEKKLRNLQATGATLQRNVQERKLNWQKIQSWKNIHKYEMSN